MRRISLKVFGLSVLFSAWYLLAEAQNQPDPVSKIEQQDVIDSIGRLLNENYVFPDDAKKMSLLLSENLSRGIYFKITDPTLFAERITEDLQSVSHDVHLVVSFNPNRVKELNTPKKVNDETIKLKLREMQSHNFGFRKVEILPGNVGYLDLENFADAGYGGETAVAAMNLLSNSSAIIIDLRNNGGGNPSMTQLIASYLFTTKPVHLNTFYNRPANTYSESWTFSFVPGKRIPDIDVYILTSNNTFSAAEEFAYDLKNLKRATIVGGVTGGGAHSGGNVIAGERFIIFIPTGKGINPVTKTDWEGIGVKPDVEVAASEALLTAQIMALQNLEKKCADSQRSIYEWPLESLKAKLHPVKVDENILRYYAGKYGARLIDYDNGNLYYHRSGNPKIKMIPLNNNMFELEGIDDFRLSFNIENNIVKGITGLYENGEFDKNMKDK
jgi:hypothetical protein